jgi:hypothetical protein
VNSWTGILPSSGSTVPTLISRMNSPRPVTLSMKALSAPFVSSSFLGNTS